MHLMQYVQHDGDIDIWERKQLPKWMIDGLKSNSITGCIEDTGVGAIG